MIPDELEKDMKSLKDRGFNFETREDGSRIYIWFKNFLLPEERYNLSKTDLLIHTTVNYPNAGFDMFWTDKTLVLKNITPPKQAEIMETHLGMSWRRFSYHPYNTNTWNPKNDSVITFVEHVQQRLAKGD